MIELIKKIDVKVYCLIILLALFFTMFAFSNQNGIESKRLSRTVTLMITENVTEIKNLNSIEKENITKRIEAVIRKLAHFTMYALMGIFAYLLVKTEESTNIKAFLIACLICIIYASIDEIHQLFVVGRSARITDVMIDTLGSFFGMIVFSTIERVIKKV